MPSPFPGMDPYLEGQVWTQFHGAFIHEAQAWLVPRIRPRYIARVEERVYVEHPPTGESWKPEPDLIVARPVRAGRQAAGDAPSIEPMLELPLPMPERHRERFIEIRLRDGGELVTAIELLSPSNKRQGGDGWKEYQRKRGQLLDTAVHLVELDLLRGGTRLPMGQGLPPGDCFAFVSRGNRRPTAGVWISGLRQPLPTVPVPLLEGEADIPLPLQELVTSVYDRTGLDYSVDYDHGTIPPLNAEDAAWASVLINRWRIENPKEGTQE